jgi:hypothetical protein
MLAADGAACVTFPSGALDHWLPLMLLKHYLLALDPTAGVHAALDHWYNARGGASDRQLPAYRHGVLVSKLGATPALAAAAERFAPRPADPHAELLARQDLQAVLHLLALERGNRGPAPLMDRLAQQERQIVELRHEVEALRAHLAAVRGGRVLRALNAMSQLLGRDRPPWQRS